YNLADGNTPDGKAVTASVSLTNCILAGSSVPGGAATTDLVNDLHNGSHTNTATITGGGPNLFQKATVDLGGAFPVFVSGEPKLGMASPETTTINLTSGSYTLRQPDNSWAGPTGLPVVTGKTLTIEGNGATIQRGSGVSFRLFAVAGGFDGLPAGHLVLRDL